MAKAQRNAALLIHTFASRIQWFATERAEVAIVVLLFLHANSTHYHKHLRFLPQSHDNTKTPSGGKWGWRRGRRAVIPPRAASPRSYSPPPGRCRRSDA